MSMKTVEFREACRLVRDDGTETYFPPGVQRIDAKDADHYWVKHHLAKKPPVQLGDEAYARAARALADQRRESADEAEAEADKAEAAWRAKYAEGLKAAEDSKMPSPGTSPGVVAEGVPPPALQTQDDAVFKGSNTLRDLDPAGGASTLPGADADTLGGGNLDAGSNTLHDLDPLKTADSIPGAEGTDTVKSAEVADKVKPAEGTETPPAHKTRRRAAID